MESKWVNSWRSEQIITSCLGGSVDRQVAGWIDIRWTEA